MKRSPFDAVKHVVRLAVDWGAAAAVTTLLS
jgi:hypothetical protein